VVSKQEFGEKQSDLMWRYISICLMKMRKILTIFQSR